MLRLDLGLGLGLGGLLGFWGGAQEGGGRVGCMYGYSVNGGLGIWEIISLDGWESWIE